MKPIIRLTLLLTVILVSCKNETVKIDTETKEESFKKVEQVVQGVFDDVWAAKKAETITKYQTDDFVLLEHGEVWTNDTIANWCKRSKLRDNGFKRTNNFDFFKAKKEGNRVWMTYHNYGTFTKDTMVSKSEWLESIVAVKLDSVWKLEMMHSTYVARQQ